MKKSRSPSVQKTIETRKKIIHSALTHFLDVGFARAKIIDIAAKANLGKGTIYSYFETKEQLFEGVIDYFLQDSLKMIQANQIQDNQTVYEFIRNEMSVNILSIESAGRAEIARLVLSEGQTFPNIRDTYYKKIFFPVQIELQQLTRLAIQRKELPVEIEPEQFALLIVSPIWMGIIQNGLLSADILLDVNDLFLKNLKLLFQQI